MSDYNIPVSGGVNGLNVPLHGHIAVYNKEFPVIPNPEGEVTGYVTKLGFTPEILQVKDPEVHDWARAEEKPTYTKAEVGLGNVNNTSDLDKPISTATQTALDGKVDKVHGKALSTNDYTDTDKAIVDGVTSALATKVDKIAGKGLSSNDYTDYEKTKLAYIQSGAEVNVQVDWFESNRWSDAFILNKPTKLSDFSNDTGFITRTVDNLTYYYKKSETYTQAEVNALVGSIVTISFLVVQSLPVTGESNIIYLVPVEDPNPNNIYEEYIYVNNSWEMIGTTAVDLSNYYTKTETDTLLSAKANSSDLSTVATSGSYADLTNKPSIDTEIKSNSTNAVQNKAIYDFLNNLLPEATETGNPISITNASGLNAKSLKVELEPIQDLNGYDSPWVGGGGKNLVDKTSVTIPTDGGFIINESFANGEATQYTASFDFNTTNSGQFLFRLYLGTSVVGEATQNFSSGNTRLSVSVTASNTFDSWRLYINKGGTASKIQVAKGTETTYYPYSNICPISGRTQTVVSVNSEDTTIPFNQTVYGGEVDVTSGGTKPKYYIEYDGSNDEYWEMYNVAQGKLFRTSSSHRKTSVELVTLGVFCNAYKVVSQQNRTDGTLSGGTGSGQYGTIDFIDNRFSSLDQWRANLSSNPIQLCFDDSNPTEINTPAFDIPLNKGNNTLTADGDMELVYSKTPQ